MSRIYSYTCSMQTIELNHLLKMNILEAEIVNALTTLSKVSISLEIIKGNFQCRWVLNKFKFHIKKADKISYTMPLLTIHNLNRKLTRFYLLIWGDYSMARYLTSLSILLKFIHNFFYYLNEFPLLTDHHKIVYKRLKSNYRNILAHS